jgi:uncharacterized protein (DUF1810 family)
MVRYDNYISGLAINQSICFGKPLVVSPPDLLVSATMRIMVKAVKIGARWSISSAFAIMRGKNRSHWMWYIFPQIAGLGLSELSRHFALKDITEAETYLRHPILGERLIRICGELLKLESNDASAIFGYPDDVKLRSSMTLFAIVSENNSIFDLIAEILRR